MFGRLATFAVLLSTLLACTSARAALSVFWRNNPITPEALANDPALTGKQSWSLMMSHTNGYWEEAGARLSLPAVNTFYRHPLGGSFRPSAPAIAANPALAFHTYVTSPHHIFGNWTPHRFSLEGTN